MLIRAILIEYSGLYTYVCRYEAGVVVVHAFNPSTRESEAGGSLSSRLAWLHREFQDSQGYTEKPCFETLFSQSPKKTWEQEGTYWKEKEEMDERSIGELW